MKFCEVCGTLLRGRGQTRFCSHKCANRFMWINRRIDPLTRIKRAVVIDPEKGCWNWQRYKSGDGYGRMALDGRFRSVVRVVIELQTGSALPSGILVHHKCGNPTCCNPQHLEPLTTSEQVERAPRRWAFVNRHRTHCARGHEFSPENTYIFVHKGRQMRVCRNCARVRYRERANLLIRGGL